MKKLLIVTALAITAGCATVPASVFTATMTYETPTWLASGKTGSVEGSGFMRQRNGVVQSCAGNEVNLIPYTPYAEERMTFIYGSAAGGSYLRNIGSPGSTPVDRDYSADWRNGICDVQGRFKFEEVPEGRWFVVTTVYWQVPSGSPYVPAITQGGPIMRPVEVIENKTVTATVSP